MRHAFALPFLVSPYRCRLYLLSFMLLRVQNVAQDPDAFPLGAFLQQLLLSLHGRGDAQGTHIHADRPTTRRRATCQRDAPIATTDVKQHILLAVEGSNQSVDEPAVDFAAMGSSQNKKTPPQRHDLQKLGDAPCTRWQIGR
eukprot:scaffold1397_cov254-Pinguiococcus_pyrenoidosus.AAC.59